MAPHAKKQALQQLEVIAEQHQRDCAASRLP
jgi:hypothetical protein